MIEPFMSHLAVNGDIVLASKSHKIKRILQDIGLTFEAIASPVSEHLELGDFSSPGDFVMQSAERKALAVIEFLNAQENQARLVIGAETVVIFEGEVFDLPRDKAEARRMLERLNGKTHEVFTGVALVLPRYDNGADNHHIKTFYEMTKVTFGSLPPDVIQAYFETEEPWNNAGGYDIEGLGGTLIESIEGDYYTIVGFPLHKFCKEISRMCSEHIL